MPKKLKQLKELEVKKKEATANVERLRLVIKNFFFPFLKEKTNNIEESSVFCQVLAGHINAQFNSLVKKVKIGELALDEIYKDDEDGQKYKEALAMVQDETIENALMIFDGMPKAIGACVNKELKSRKLSELTELAKDFE
jgi:hypothetical protein